MSQTFSAERVLEYPGGYTRSVGPVIGRFLTGLRDGRILGVRLADGRVLVPPTEYDPATSAPVASEGDHWVEVGPIGTVQAFTWVAQPRAGKHTLSRPFAFALIRPDGADTALLHMVDCGSADAIAIGSRVAPRWRAERTGYMTDIEAWVPLADGEQPVPAPVRVPTAVTHWIVAVPDVRPEAFSVVFVRIVPRDADRLPLALPTAAGEKVVLASSVAGRSSGQTTEVFGRPASLVMRKV